MQRRARPLIVLALSGIAVLVMGAAAPLSGDVTISNPGVGDYAGFHIVVHPDGHASAVDATGKASGELSDQLASQLFADLRLATNAAQDAKPCAAAAADTNGRVGYTAANAAISIAWQGHNWSSLACASDTRLVALSSDASAIERALYVQAYRKRPMYVYIGGATGYAAGTSGATYTSTYPSTSGYGTSFGNYGNNPMSGYPSGTLPNGSLPTTSLSGGLPTSSLSGSSPYSSLPTTSLPSGNLPSSSVFTSLPYIGL